VGTVTLKPLENIVPGTLARRSGSSRGSLANWTQSGTFRAFCRWLIPPAVRQLRRQVAFRRHLRHALDICAGLSVEQTFETIYKNNLWGGLSGDFYSGTGSEAEFVDPYCNYVRRFIRENGIKSIVDLGCGDFRVGQKLVAQNISYVGIDVVSSLIDRNTREFGRDGISFQTINAIEHPPPAGDLCLIRQVLQHLSNEQIITVIRNCRSFRYLIVSDHTVLNRPFAINADKPHGFDTRPSGIQLDKPPFSYDVRPILEVRSGPHEVIRTVLIEQEPWKDTKQ
jgi:hypothetical protein